MKFYGLTNDVTVKQHESEEVDVILIDGVVINGKELTKSEMDDIFTIVDHNRNTNDVIDVLNEFLEEKGVNENAISLFGEDLIEKITTEDYERLLSEQDFEVSSAEGWSRNRCLEEAISMNEETLNKIIDNKEREI